MNALELAEQAKKKNIIDMTVCFSAMMPLFQKHSDELIKEELASLYDGLERINLDRDLTEMHGEFCQWFVRTIMLSNS